MHKQDTNRLIVFVFKEGKGRSRRVEGGLSWLVSVRTLQVGWDVKNMQAQRWNVKNQL